MEVAHLSGAGHYGKHRDRGRRDASGILPSGDLDVRFVLKVVTVLVVAGGVFAYCLESLREGRLSAGRNQFFAIAAVVIVGFGVVLGFAQIESPAAQRSKTEDTRRRF